ncbi:TPA: MGRN1 protein-like [Bos taurus]|nr:TPA: MGRN1 protein-like [Bos taurus]
MRNKLSPASTDQVSKYVFCLVEQVKDLWKSSARKLEREPVPRILSKQILQRIAEDKASLVGNRPVQFPYVTPAPHEPVKTLRSLVNIRKDSLRLVRYKDGADSPTEDGEKPRVLYSLEFTFDADARVAITVYCQAVEEFLNGTAAYSPKSPALQSETVHYKRGVSQQFSLPSFKIDFSEWKDDELNFDLDRGVFPVVIQAVVDEGDVVEVTGHAHVLLAAFEKHVDGSFSMKPLKQKQIVDRVSYLLQEIYGIENKNNQETKPSDEENSDNSNECVVCLSDLRDTLILMQCRKRNLLPQAAPEPPRFLPSSSHCRPQPFPQLRGSRSDHKESSPLAPQTLHPNLSGGELSLYGAIYSLYSCD